jgi:exopolysaccharide biosynthesis polyprenyl glycosylphosphotransferase
MVGVLGALGLNRLYDEDTLFPGGGEIPRVFRSVVEAFALLSATAFVLHRVNISRGWIALTALLTLSLVAGTRVWLRQYLARERSAGRKRRPAVVVSKDGRGWPGWLDGDFEEFDIVAHLSLADIVSPNQNGGPRPGHLGDSGLEALGSSYVMLINDDDFSEDDLWRIVLHAGQAKCSIFVRSRLRTVARDRLCLRHLKGHSIVKVAPPALRGFRAAQKRAFDLAVAGPSLLLSIPLMVLVGLAVVATSGWPILFAQERVGRGGKVFKMWKFRTMRRDAEETTGAVWATAGDPRRTRLGAILRRTSLDELPQLWNVVKGDMSLVGPRPERPVFVDRFAADLPWYRYRHRIRPGITGWAQSEGFRGNTSVTSRVDFDNLYIEHWSIWLDLRILLKTAREVLRGENAY